MTTATQQRRERVVEVGCLCAVVAPVVVFALAVLAYSVLG